MKIFCLPIDFLYTGEVDTIVQKNSSSLTEHLKNNENEKDKIGIIRQISKWLKVKYEIVLHFSSMVLYDQINVSRMNDIFRIDAGNSRGRGWWAVHSGRNVSRISGSRSTKGTLINIFLFL